jgi:UrcA family protein
MSKTISAHQSMSRYAPVLAPVLAILATAAVFSVPDTAMAQTQKTTETVKISDLDLSTEAGQRTLDRRIQRAARAACKLDTVRTGSRIASPSATACYNEALRSTQTQVADQLADTRQGG